MHRTTRALTTGLAGAALAAVAVSGTAIGIGGAPGAFAADAVDETTAPADPAATTPAESPAPAETTAPAETPPPGPDANGVCSIDELVAASAGPQFHGVVKNADTGQTLFQRDDTASTPVASNVKLVTVAAALEVLGPDATLDTHVFKGDEPGEIVVHGGGDYTLSSLPDPSTGYYDDPGGSLGQLAEQARAGMGGEAITKITVDERLFDGPSWHDTWLEADRGDVVGDVSSFMVDGGRRVATERWSERSADPSGDAARKLALALEVPGVTADDQGAITAPEGAIEVGGETPTTQWLGETKSQPLSELTTQLLVDSDNMGAEALARVTAHAVTGENAGFDDIQAGALAGMSSIGLDTNGLSLVDGSGLSRDDLVSTDLLSDLLEAVREDAATGGPLAVMADNLASSHETGTLANRFDPEKSGVPAGAIDAKTGFIEEAHALSGYMDAADGTTLVFSFAAVGVDAHVTDADRDHLDRIAAQTYACGGKLTSGGAAA